MTDTGDVTNTNNNYIITFRINSVRCFSREYLDEFDFAV